MANSWGNNLPQNEIRYAKNTGAAVAQKNLNCRNLHKIYGPKMLPTPKSEEVQIACSQIRVEEETVPRCREMRVPASLNLMGVLVTEKDAWGRLEVALLFCDQVTTASSSWAASGKQCATSGAKGAAGGERVQLLVNSVQRILSAVRPTAMASSESERKRLRRMPCST
jgi:hypothetical protein